MEKRMFGATDGIRAEVGTWPIRPSALKHLGEIAGKYFGAGKTIWLGRDTRAGGVWLREALRAGAESGGLKVQDGGVLPTPALSVLVKTSPEVVGGIMLTASHNPATDNGVKVFRADGEKLSDDEELAFEEMYFAEPEGEDVEPEAPAELDLSVRPEAVRRYIDALRGEFGELKLDGEILYDSASGAGHEFDRAVLAEFGLQTELISPTPDGENINVDCGALHPEKLAEEARKRKRWGVAMDGDADRVLLADEQGRIWDGDRTLALLAVNLLEQGKLNGGGVVATEYSNYALLNYLRDKEVNVEKVVNGDRFVAEKCVEQGFVLGAEASGHIIYVPWLSSSDACFVTLAVAQILQAKNCQLAELWPDYEAMPSKQWALAVREKRALPELQGWNETLAEVEAELQGRGRVFCRYSGTEAKLRILVEAEDEALLEKSGERLAQIIKREIGK